MRERERGAAGAVGHRPADRVGARVEALQRHVVVPLLAPAVIGPPKFSVAAVVKA